MTGQRAGDQPAVATRVEAAGGDLEAMSVLLEVLAVAEVAFGLTAAGMLLLVLAVADIRLSTAIPAGGLLLATGVLGLMRLPVALAAVALLVLAAGSLLMEVLILPGLLLHATGGGVALGLAGLWLRAPDPGAHPMLAAAVGVTATTVTWLAAGRSWRAIRDDPLAPSERLPGRTGTVLDTHGRHGHAVIAGQVWTIHSASAPLQAGARVEVLSTAADELIVRPTRFDPG